MKSPLVVAIEKDNNEVVKELLNANARVVFDELIPVGSKVTAFSKGEGKWCSGKIIAIFAGNRYRVIFDDGQQRIWDLRRSMIRREVLFFLELLCNYAYTILFRVKEYHHCYFKV